MSTLRKLVSDVRGMHKLLSTDSLITDRVIASEIKNNSLLLIKRETNLRKLWATDTLFTTLPCLEMIQVPISECCDYVINTAAETHVGNSIANSDDFVHSNVNGVHNLLELIKNHRGENISKPTLLHFSTDEVYGDIEEGEHIETDLLKPSNPYSATKAAADMLVMAWGRTYGLPYIIVRPTNNYGIGQYVEKLIPKTCKYLKLGRKVPLHNGGTPIRNWLHAQDTADAIITIINAGVKNEIYNICGGFEQNNLETVKKICILNNCDNAIYQPFGHTWLKPDQYNKEHNKKFQLSHLCGKLNKTYGHSLRHETLARQNEFSIPLNFYDVYGDRSNIEDARLGKEFIFGDSQFGVVIENTSHRGYFTEKILDCFLLKTIPIYWGCSNIGDYFDIDGIITFDNVDDLIYKTNQLNESYYENRKEIIEKNWKLALEYVDYEQNVVNTITNIFKHNKLI